MVDDEQPIREGLKSLLERQGFDVSTAGDPWDAVRWIKRRAFDGLLIDLELTPESEVGINGLDVIALLRVHQPRAKAILISASMDSALTRLAEGLGTAARFEKPLDPGALTRLLTTLFPREQRPPAFPGAMAPVREATEA